MVQMMGADDRILQLIGEVGEEDLRDVILEWSRSHPDFMDFVMQKLQASIEETNFSLRLSQKVDKETKEFFSRHDLRVATDWGNVYSDFIEPWCEQAGSLSTDKLYELIDVIVTEVGMRVTEEDFYGDDWYGDDFYGDIADIMSALGRLAGLLLIREDLSPVLLDRLKRLMSSAQKQDVIDEYVGAPYAFILELIGIRENAETVSCALFDSMIENRFAGNTGDWICRKIDFMRSKGHNDEAQQYMESQIEHPEVCLKHYNELLASGNIQQAMQLLDQAHQISENRQNRFLLRPVKWLELKQQLLDEHGTEEERINNLVRLFHDTYGDKSVYYHRLKDMVSATEWKGFYHNLLSNATGYDVIDRIALFLIEEGEYEWLFNLLSQEEKTDPTDYRTPLNYAGKLSSTHFDLMQAMLVRTFRAYAAERFARKKNVKILEYQNLCSDLRKLAACGYVAIQHELVAYLLTEYHFRPSFVKELRAMS